MATQNSLTGCGKKLREKNIKHQFLRKHFKDFLTLVSLVCKTESSNLPDFLKQSFTELTNLTF